MKAGQAILIVGLEAELGRGRGGLPIPRRSTSPKSVPGGSNRRNRSDKRNRIYANLDHRRRPIRGRTGNPAGRKLCEHPVNVFVQSEPHGRIVGCCFHCRRFELQHVIQASYGKWIRLQEIPELNRLVRRERSGRRAVDIRVNESLSASFPKTSRSS